MKNLLLTGLLLSLVSCGLFSPEPKTVAEKFWLAMQANDLEKVRELITPDGLKDLSEVDGDEIKIDSFELGEVLKGETNSYVMVTIVGPDFNLTFKTALQKVSGEWKVNYKETMDELMRAQIREMGNAFREGIEDAGTEMAEQFKGVAEALKQGMQEMKKAMDESLKEMDDKGEAVAPGGNSTGGQM